MRSIYATCFNMLKSIEWPTILGNIQDKNFKKY